MSEPGTAGSAATEAAGQHGSAVTVAAGGGSALAAAAGGGSEVAAAEGVSPAPLDPGGKGKISS